MGPKRHDADSLGAGAGLVGGRVKELGHLHGGARRSTTLRVSVGNRARGALLHVARLEALVHRRRAARVVDRAAVVVASERAVGGAALGLRVLGRLLAAHLDVGVGGVAMVYARRLGGLAGQGAARVGNGASGVAVVGGGRGDGGGRGGRGGGVGGG